jgi:hypothetical protein
MLVGRTTDCQQRREGSGLEGWVQETLIAARHLDWGEVQGNYHEFRFFTGLRPSEQIALVVTDYNAANGVLCITKARGSGIDRDRTKIAEDRRVVLNARARSVLERQLQLWERFQQAGRLHHEHLFFHANGEPIPRLHQAHGHWRLTRTLAAILQAARRAPRESPRSAGPRASKGSTVSMKTRQVRGRFANGDYSDLSSREGPLELENGVPNTRTGIIHAAALVVEDHRGARA